MSEISIVEADLTTPEHQHAIVELVDAYARDPMGNGAPLPTEVRASLIPGLQALSTTVVLLAYRGSQAIGIAVCFRGFSTFTARPLINIHDLAVVASERGQGVGQRLLDAVEETARRLGCCKVTLEVQERNHRARHVYAAAGFARAAYQPEAGGALFLAKQL